MNRALTWIAGNLEAAGFFRRRDAETQRKPGIALRTTYSHYPGLLCVSASLRRKNPRAPNKPSSLGPASLFLTLMVAAPLSALDLTHATIVAQPSKPVTMLIEETE